jgi:ABC-type multidrug transport system ATPase subunit
MINQLKIHDTTHSFDGKYILSAISLELLTGEVIGIFGRNGSGKSTLLKIIFGIIKAHHFSIEMNQNKLNPKEVIEKKLIGYLPQDSFLPKSKKVRDVISLFFKNSVKQDQIFYAPRVNNFEHKKIGYLSLGELRYLEFLILANLDHPFLLLDEPFSMIEPLYKEAIKERIRLIQPQKGIILTDHYYDDVLDISTKKYLIKSAQLIEVKHKEDLYEHNYLNSIW